MNPAAMSNSELAVRDFPLQVDWRGLAGQGDLIPKL